MDVNEAAGQRAASLVFAGGMGLGAYHAGVFEELARQRIVLKGLSGSSVGAVTTALIAGNPESARLDVLRRYWKASQNDFGPRSKAQGWLNAIQARLIGRSDQFNPRPFVENFAHFLSVYDLRPLRDRLAALVDFGRLNSGDVRVCLAATDITSGEPVIFDTAAGARITLDHVLASCGYIPEFPAVRIDGKLFGDGGLSINAPFEPLLESGSDEDLFIVDLYARDGMEPDSLTAATERRNDLIFANQTWLRLRARLCDASLTRRRIFFLSYRSVPAEPGPEKLFDLSGAAVSDRWTAGSLDMRQALAQHVQRGREVIAIRRG